MKIVLDTNIYIAAALNDSGYSEDILKQISKSAAFTLIISDEILLEIENKLSSKFHWVQGDIDRFITKIRNFSVSVEVNEKLSVVKRDPEDNKILECALSGQANLIITLDQDLIKLKNFRGIGIIHPETFSWTFPEYFKKSKA